MKTISQERLKDRVASGWEIDSVTKAKPVKKPKKLIKDVISEGIKESSDANTKAIAAMAKAMGMFLRAQSQSNDVMVKRLNILSEPKVAIPEVRVGKKRWKFNVKRDHRGFIENMIAEEI